jgi:tRNA (Thr-GGU) A37 N-methylase
MVDGTPLLNIKPYVPELDCSSADRIGWLTGKVKQQGEPERMEGSDDKTPLPEMLIRSL